MGDTAQRQTNQLPAWLMSPGVAVGIVVAIVKKQAEEIGEFVGLLRSERTRRTARRAPLTGRGRVAIYLAGGASLLALCAALAVLKAEGSSPNANITDFGDATWWAVTSMATVGYGDRYPVTGIGRLVGFGLMAGGIALVSIVTATLMSWFVESVQTAKKQTEALQATMR